MLGEKQIASWFKWKSQIASTLMVTDSSLKHRSDSLDKEIFLHLTVLSFFTKAYRKTGNI